jgi:Reverse transcriptase (RNA-dependent DNA polymerase)
MAVKLGEPFGIGSPNFEKLDLPLALKRVRQDLKTDFIYAPHLGLIFARAGDDLIDMLSTDLKNGNYAPGLPITIEVPKSFRIPVGTTKRLGPAYTRPGSILMPKDRLLYQAFADLAAPIIEKGLDPARSFSHQLAEADSEAMFVPTRKCWNDLQTALTDHSSSENIQYVMRLDVANYFGSINQHLLINVLSDAGFEKWVSERLEVCLTAFTGARSSRAILQGIFPSDLFGNFYMAPVDRFLADANIPSARYVDDLYVFVESVDAADRLLRELIPFMRSYDLSLNENKSSILPKNLLATMEPDLEALFQAAAEEISGQLNEDDFQADYGFQSEWEGDDDEVEDQSDDDDFHSIELVATIHLFNSIDMYPGQEENVERFCLPLFAKANSKHAVAHVIGSFRRRPAMAQIYSSYLANFLDEDNVRQFLSTLIQDPLLHDWQKMWILAALMLGPKPEDALVKLATDILKDGNQHDALRAVAGYFVGRFGDHARRTALKNVYQQCAPYIQAAIYASSRFWPNVEANNAKATWGPHGLLNQLLTKALEKKAI